jgi:hypothetical protein
MSILSRVYTVLTWCPCTPVIEKVADLRKQEATLAHVPPLRRTLKSPHVCRDWWSVSDSDMHVGISDIYAAWSAGSTPRTRFYFRFEFGIELLNPDTSSYFVSNDPQDVMSVLRQIRRRSCPYPTELNPRICGMQVPFARALHGSIALEILQQPASQGLASCIVPRDVDENLNLNLLENGARKRDSAAFFRMNYCDGSGVTLPSFADRFSTQAQGCSPFVE